MPFITKVICISKELRQEYCGTLRDISIVGLFMEMKDCPDVGGKCDVSIIFEGSHSRLLIENIGGKIIRCGKSGIAIRFDKRLEWFVLIPIYFKKTSECQQRLRGISAHF
jgi:hypothetical protein